MEHLTTLLEERVADIPVGAPPIDAMRAAARRRRGRTAVLAAAAAVVVIAAGAVVWQSVGAPDPRVPVASDAPDPDAPPAGHRYVGIGTAVIAVPEGWGTNDVECGTPKKDTVVIDQGVTCMMWVPRPADVESVAVLSTAKPEGVDTWASVEVDGVRALQSDVQYTSDPVGVSAQSIYLPSRHVLFTAESSSAGSTAVVTDLLSGIAILQEHTTVPGFQDIALEYGLPNEPVVDSYVARLQNLGLSVEVVQQKSDLDKGTVLSTNPAVGSVVAPGDTVTVTVSG